MSDNQKKLNFTKTPLDGLVVIERNIISDQRGTFFRMFCEQELNEVGLDENISQVNYSFTKNKYTTRGFHFQYEPYSESKIITCVRGEVYDVALDLRRGSSTFLKAFGVVLSEKNCKSHCLPKGFAHAFQSLTDECGLVYLHSSPYNVNYEGGINVHDPRVAISWPYKPQNMSQKDLCLPMLSSEFEGI
jgi:dTDP-4-dehydrorhamnose 3,5-epimerase